MDLDKPAKVAISAIETALLNAILEYLQKHAYAEVSHLINAVMEQTKFYTLDHVIKTAESIEEKGVEDDDK